MMSDRPGRELEGRTAVVTGSSRGIGRAVAIELAEAGAAVVVHGCRSGGGAEGLVGRVAELGGAARLILADLAQPEEQDRLADEAWRWRSGVDIWVNNAGADILTGGAAKWTFEGKLDLLWRVDVAATIRLARRIGQWMDGAGGGVILNMGWDGAVRGMAGASGELFAAAKGAVMAFSRSLARSLAPRVRVNCLAPGWIKTAWGDAASAYWRERAVRESLLRRWGTPEDVARVARFLVSPAAAFLTGQVIEVNGGFEAALPPFAPPGPATARPGEQPPGP